MRATIGGSAQYHGMGDEFMPAQIVADLEICRAAAVRFRLDGRLRCRGPGSRRGLNCVLGRPVDAPWTEAEWRKEFDRLREAIAPDLERLGLGDLARPRSPITAFANFRSTNESASAAKANAGSAKVLAASYFCRYRFGRRSWGYFISPTNSLRSDTFRHSIHFEPPGVLTGYLIKWFIRFIASLFLFKERALVIIKG